ncbi:MAG: hypothetical protein ACTSU5_21545 [Promethearchaeota archaeon]
MDLAEKFYQSHEYLGALWKVLEERDDYGVAPGNHLNYNFSWSPVRSFLDAEYSKDPTKAALFRDPVLVDFFKEVTQYHLGMAWSWERSGFLESPEPFTEKIRVFHDYFENAAANLKETIEERHGLSFFGFLDRVLPLLGVLSEELYLISSFCLKVGVPDPVYLEYYTTFSEILQKCHDLYQVARSMAGGGGTGGAGGPPEEDGLSLTLSVVLAQVLVYVVMFGFPFFMGYESHAWCPVGLDRVFNEELRLGRAALQAYSTVAPATEVDGVLEWYKQHFNEQVLPRGREGTGDGGVVVLEDLPTTAKLPEEILHNNLRLLVEARGMATLGLAGQGLREKFGASAKEVALYLYRYSNPSEFTVLFGDVGGTGYAPEFHEASRDLSPRPPTDPFPGALAGPLLEPLPETLPEPSPRLLSELKILSAEFDELTLTLTPENVLDPPTLEEVSFLLKFLGVAGEPGGGAGA